ncbi:hypothetical protein, partial [Acidithiobacillus ferriphilus]
QFFRDHHLTPIRGVSAPQHSTPYPLNLTKSHGSLMRRALTGPNPAAVSWEARSYPHPLLKVSRG